MKRSRMHRPWWMWTVLPLLVAAAVIAGERRSDNDALFSEAVYLDRVGYLASDELEGRGTGQEGIDKAADYIAAEFAEMGVLPGGDNGTYFQNFTLSLSRRIGDGTFLQVGLDGDAPEQAAELRTDYTVFPFSASDSFEGEVVFAGYGIVCEDEDYNDYAGVDVAGKVVLVLRRAPRFAEFSRADMAFRTKASRANGREAAALLIVNPTYDEEGDTLLEFGDSSLGGPGSSGSSYGLPMLHVRRELAERLLRAGGLPDLATIERQIDETKKPMSAALGGVRVRGHVTIDPIESPVKNVVGVIPGKGPNADEYIVLGAHYDHLGIVRKGEEDFDPNKHIWNGADDNASGTALVITVAEAFSRSRPPNRSLLLVLFTGEERGLLGSKHFVNHPTVELKKIVTMLNFDMVGRLRKDTLEVGGMRTGGFEETVRRLAEAQGLQIKDGGGGRGPSDHTSFYNKNIPVMFFFTGLHKQYHQPDDLVPLLNIPGTIRIAKLVADIVDEIDAAAAPPKFARDNRGARGIRRSPDADDQPDMPQIAAARRTDDRHADRQPDGSAGDRMRLGIHPDPSTKKGVGVLEVIDDTPASRAGMLEGDRIVRLADKDVVDVETLLSILDGFRWGDASTITVQRGRKELKLPIQFGEARTPHAAVTRQESEGAPSAKVMPDHGHKSASSASDMEDLIVAYMQWIKRRESLTGQSVEVKYVSRPSECVIEIQGLDPAVSTRIDDELLELLRRMPNGTRRLEISTALTTDKTGKLTAEISIRIPIVTPVAPHLPDTHTHGHAAAVPSDAHAGITDSHRNADSKKLPGKDPHADLPDDVTATPMPPVRLGIMPSYGETEGEGYEITGVVEDGPAAKAGMKDDDRILKIGECAVTDVYSYMECLRKYKPGDEIPVMILRDGRQITLKVRADGPQSKEAA